MDRTDDGATEQGRRLVELTHDECWALLATSEVGRLGVTSEHYPLVVPVNYAADGEVLVVRTASGPTLDAASSANVTFEVDALDPVTRTGWSVLVRGLAERVTERHRPELVGRTRAAGAQPWAPGERDEWLRILPHRVTGRRVVAAELPPPCEPAGYL